MTISSAKRAAFGGLFVAASLLFSYVETLLPLSNVISIPGMKLGLANVCVMLAVYLLGTVDGLFVAVGKTLLTAILFGTPVSFAYSFVGGMLAFLFTLFCKYVIKDRISYIGVSVGGAALHNVGQILVASVIFKDTAVFWYLEWLLPISLITGIITGVIALAFDRILEKKI